jgi:2-(1,2-epoxy-1,2-dihydrophenyl)acetyl-CoA isomerase
MGYGSRAMTVRTSVEGGVATILLDRPEVRNAMNLELLAGIRAGLEEAAEHGARAAVLAGAGGTFCAGADLAYVRQAFDGDAEAVLRPLVTTLHELIGFMRGLPFPIVATLEGYAVGAGMGLALAADARVASRSASLLPGYFAIGASPDGGVSYFLTRALGGARATSLILRNTTLGADELLALGLVEEVVDDGQALAAAQALAAELTSVPPLALVRMRQLVDSASVQLLQAQLDDEERLVAELWPAADFKEGVSAFLERRRPQFAGR